MILVGARILEKYPYNNIKPTNEFNFEEFTVCHNRVWWCSSQKYWQHKPIFVSPSDKPTVLVRG
ncbi:hypothetical protein RINTHM_14840 [Richelia intracellularis HM01]|nr:hypothetical protein RINTHM_14840 [Richelia intracellularis HM01]